MSPGRVSSKGAGARRLIRSAYLVLLLLLLLVVAGDAAAQPPDRDGDRFSPPADCVDTNRRINPGAKEIPGNGVDEDCSGADALADKDADGFSPPADCNDADALRRPGAKEVPGNGIDEDCSGADAPVDNDADGFSPPADCNDSSAGMNPRATDIPDNGIDEDCTGGEPVRLLNPFPVVRLRGKVVGGGVFIRTLAVRAPVGATVQVSCKGRGCPRRTQTQSSGRRRSLRFRKLRGFLGAGTVIRVYVTQPGTIGKYVRFTVRKTRPPARRDWCVMPGSTSAARCPFV